MDELLVDCDQQQREVYLSVLAPHWCEYPLILGHEKIPPVQQTNGQLMGSILSFPILCLANLGLYLWNIMDDPRSLRQKLSGVLVNGDDMLYCGPKDSYLSHIDKGNRAGLVMSPGKAYLHRKYANANSACYHYDLTVENSTPKYIPFLNVGLYFGQSKVLGDDEEKFSLSTTINRLLQGSISEEKSIKLLSSFLSRHSSSIAEECEGRNLFLPVSLGGLGVHKPDGFKTRVTFGQRVLASYLADRPYIIPDVRPAECPDIAEAPVELKAPWLMRKDPDREPLYRKILGLKDVKYSRKNAVVPQWLGGSVRLINSHFLAVGIRRGAPKLGFLGSTTSYPKATDFRREIFSERFASTLEACDTSDKQTNVIYYHPEWEDLSLDLSNQWGQFTNDLSFAFDVEFIGDDEWYDFIHKSKPDTRFKTSYSIREKNLLRVGDPARYQRYWGKIVI
jgi:hypothetical protein